jgi:hypothetical protein
MDLLPDAIQLEGSRDGSGSGLQAWIVNAAHAPITPSNQCFFIDNLNGIDNSTAPITADEVDACIEIILGSQMFALNSCPL